LGAPSKTWGKRLEGVIVVFRKQSRESEKEKKGYGW